MEQRTLASEPPPSLCMCMCWGGGGGHFNVLNDILNNDYVCVLGGGGGGGGFK